MEKLNIEELKKLLKYEPESGKLLWIVNRGKVKIGNEAGSIYQDHGMFYRQVMVNYKRYQVHSIIFALCYNRWPERVDHYDRNGLNNKIENLREVTRSQNQWNRSMQCNNSSGYKGVYNHKRAFVAQIYKHSKKYYLGRFQTPEEAHAAYCEASKQLHGEYGRTQ